MSRNNFGGLKIYHVSSFIRMTCKMGVSGAKEVKFNTGLPLLQEEKFNRAQTHRWRSDKYYCWDAIFIKKIL